ncbi:hypothetical protein A9G13_05600 [Gilliamella sp. wkB178]|uniref:glycosyltransferase family 2 protein n=1 Tax=Gilliamella sp. wkB178 TaxID=3120259 RepID=UPI00080DDE84|nr:glycosyltransferase family 2 protein [Gilliamella apicola]OCG07689.1 hypothetical protein A9G13_05600 [Gilliamella apicola]
MKDKMPLVSIIIPIYNSSTSILNTLASIEAQSYKNYEVIMINDGSIDNSLEIIEKYQRKKNNVIVYSQQNSGVSAARNKGIELANGEFITFLDSDDIYSPIFLEKMVSKQKEKNTNLVFCGYNRINSSGKIIIIPCLFNEENILKSYLQRNGYFHFSGFLIKKSMLVENCIYFEEGVHISEDLLFTVKLLNSADCSCVKEYLFNYVQRSGSVMLSSWSDSKWLSDIRGHKQILDYLIENYHKSDKQEILALASAWIFQREISYLIDCIKKMKYQKIKCYLDNITFNKQTKLCENSKLNNKDWKKYEIIKKNNRIIWFFYTLYYRFLRFNLKIF